MKKVFEIAWIKYWYIGVCSQYWLRSFMIGIRVMTICFTSEFGIMYSISRKKKKSKFPLISFAVISNFPWKLRNPFYYKAQTRQIPSLIKPSMSVCGRAAKYVPNHLRLNAFFKKNRVEK